MVVWWCPALKRFKIYMYLNMHYEVMLISRVQADRLEEGVSGGPGIMYIYIGLYSTSEFC